MMLWSHLKERRKWQFVAAKELKHEHQNRPVDDEHPKSPRPSHQDDEHHTWCLLSNGKMFIRNWLGSVATFARHQPSRCDLSDLIMQ